MICDWCKGEIPAGVAVSSSRRFCKKACRQSAWRLRQRASGTVATSDGTTPPGSFRYADPPYPGLAAKYYRKEATFAGEVDFAQLVAELEASRVAGESLGWALSTSARSLREILPLCPPIARVCAWVKPIGACSRTYGIHNTWEPLIVMPGRHLRPGKRDWLRAAPARGGGRLPGRKPIAFCAWLFELLGMLPGDTLIDMYPGTGAISRAWAELSRRTAATPAPGASLEAMADAEPSREISATSGPSTGAGVTAAASPVPGTTAAASFAPGSATAAASLAPGPTQARLL
jgi:hypothetical protein